MVEKCKSVTDFYDSVQNVVILMAVRQENKWIWNPLKTLFCVFHWFLRGKKGRLYSYSSLKQLKYKNNLHMI